MRGGNRAFQLTYRMSQKKRSLRISKPLGPTDASGDEVLVKVVGEMLDDD